MFKKKKDNEKAMNMAGNMAIAGKEILRIEKNPQKALKIASVWLLALSNQDITIEEIQSQIRSIINVLLDTKTVNKMINMGLRGITRKSTVTDWDLLFNSLNMNMDKITGVLNG